MSKINEIASFLGSMYQIVEIDKGESVYRKINESFEIEIYQINGNMTANVWQIKPHRELMAIYTDIYTLSDLADTVGYLAFIYGNLSKKIRLERADLPQ